MALTATGLFADLRDDKNSCELLEFVTIEPAEKGKVTWPLSAGTSISKV